MGNELMRISPAEMGAPTPMFSPERIDVIRRTVAKDCDDLELELFLAVCQRTRLDPIARQIYAVSRWSKQANRKVMTIQTSIDGFRVIADRSEHYAGQLPPEWCGPDGQWRDVWLEKTPPAAARVAVLRHGWKEPLYAVARYDSYFQENNHLWKKMPEVMIAKCAEALALRKAFPQDLSGLYTTDEMGQASNEITELPSANQNAPRQQIASGSNGNPMTPNQKRYIEALARDVGMDEPGLIGAVKRRYGKAFADLTKSEASALVEALQVVKDDQANAGFADAGEKTLDGEMQRSSAPQARAGIAATEAQKRKLFATADERGWHDDQIHGRAAEINPAVTEDGIGALDRAEMSRLIEAVINETPWVDPRQQRLDVDAPAADGSQPSDEAMRGHYLDTIQTADSPERLSFDWGQVVKDGWQDDAELMYAAHGALKAFIAAAESVSDCNQALKAMTAIGFAGDDELQGALKERKAEIKAQG